MDRIFNDNEVDVEKLIKGINAKVKEMEVLLFDYEAADERNTKSLADLLKLKAQYLMTYIQDLEDNAEKYDLDPSGEPDWASEPSEEFEAKNEMQVERDAEDKLANE